MKGVENEHLTSSIAISSAFGGVPGSSVDLDAATSGSIAGGDGGPMSSGTLW